MAGVHEDKAFRSSGFGVWGFGVEGCGLTFNLINPNPNPKPKPSNPTQHAAHEGETKSRTD